MKRTGICSKCNSRRVLKLSVVADASDYTGSSSDAVAARKGHNHSPRAILAIKGGGVAGQTEAYVCAEDSLGADRRRLGRAHGHALSLIG